MDVTNAGFIAGKAPSGNRTMFLDRIFRKVKQLVEKNGDLPDKTPIEQRCEAMKLENQEKEQSNEKQNNFFFFQEIVVV